MQLQREQQTSFARGMNDTSAPGEFNADEVALLYNGRVSFLGNALDVRGGSAKTHGSALNSGTQGLGGKEFVTAAGAQQICVFVGNKFYYSTDEGATWTNPSGATGLATAYWSMVQMRVGASNYLVCVNGSTAAYYWDGTTWGTLANAPAGAKYAAVFNDRLYLAGHSGVEVAACAVANPASWAAPAGFTVQFTTHDGEQEITGLYQLGPVLLAFKRESTGYLEGFGFNTIDVEAGGRGLSRSVGLLAHRSIAPAGTQGCAWLSELGFVHYQIGGVIELISRPVQNFMDTVSYTNIKSLSGQPTAMYWPQKNEYWCAIPSATGQNDYVFRWRPATATSPPCVMLDTTTDTGTHTVFVNATTGNLEFQADQTRDLIALSSGNITVVTKTTGGLYAEIDSGNLALDETGYDHTTLFTADRDTDGDITAPWSVGYDGFVRKCEIGTTDNSSTVAADDGIAIELRVKSRPFVFGDNLRRKVGRTFRISSTQDAVAAVTLIPVYDGNDGASKTISMPISSDFGPVAKKTRTKVKGFSLQADIRTTSSLSLAGIEAIATVMREGY